ncbi:MAG TPA: translocation/assembly module TamB domain-containing protein, partial [Chthoniobacterales bacterium]|nr:translocation/assembly module TamB domain-containing protein [Chthoniobacterales bacterium]
QVVNLDASKIDAKQLDVAVEGTFAGAQVNGTVTLGEKEKSLETRVDLLLENTSLAAVTKYLEPPQIEQGRIKEPEVEAQPESPGVHGNVRRLAVNITGQLDRPNSWNGAITGEIENLAAGGVVFDRVTIDAKAAEGRATIDTLELRRGENRITLQGSADLPARTEEFGRVPATFQLRALVPDLRSLTAGMAQPISGPAEVNGQISVRDATIHADLAAVAGPVDFGKGAVQRAVMRLRASKRMPPPMPDEEDVGRETVPPPYFANLESDIAVEISEVRFGEYAIDSVTADVRTAEKDVFLEQLVVNRSENRLRAEARYQLPVNSANAASQPGFISVDLDAPDVSDFWVADAANKISGSLQLSAQTDLGPTLGGGYFQLYGTNLAAQKLTIPAVSAHGTIAQNIVYLNDLTARLNERDFIAAHGTAGIKAPYPYSGSLALNVADLGAFEPLLATAGKKTELAGALAINWHGNGALSGFKNNGDLKLTLRDGRFADLDELEATIDANYTPEELNVPIVYAASDRLMFQAIMQAKGSTLEMTKIQVIQGEAKYADGYVSVPFVWANLGTDRPLFPTDGEVLVSFQTQNLEIDKLTKDLGKEVPVSGLVNVNIEAQGTPENLRATADLRLTGLRSEKLEDFTPATFALNARVENDQLIVNGRLEQARIEPVQITAEMPLPVARIIENKKLDEETPVRARVQMPRSSVNFVRQFVPALQRIDGNAALDVNIGGTIAAPVFSGSADMTINAARFSNATLPALTNFNARLVFDGDSLNFQQFRGELAGGPFTVTGQIGFPKLTEPTFNLQLRADAVLVARNDDMTVRTDADIRVVGPLNSATVSGNIGITNSQFLKNLDLIPIGMPGRPPPAPKPPAARPDLSFPNPPLRDWKFDIAIRTKDPFVIRGNLANGGALVDMKLSGTGLEPRLDGSVRLQNVEATLPFSRLEITQGFIYFNPDDPFNPGLDLQGTSLIKDYTVRVYVYGTANNPEAVFTSEPPLPQEEIITLLATGTTREELMSGGNVLAGRALMLLGQQLYHKVFKKGQEPSSTNSFFDRLQLDVGNVDPRTGQQTATARYRVNENWRIIGDIGVEGDFRGTVKYLIRFR